jgi:hypothetical protein
MSWCLENLLIPTQSVEPYTPTLNSITILILLKVRHRHVVRVIIDGQDLKRIRFKQHRMCDDRLNIHVSSSGLLFALKGQEY